MPTSPNTDEPRAVQEPDPVRGSIYDTFQTSAWIGMVEFLLGQEWAIAQFTADTGMAVPRRRSGIEMMIDKAAGYDGNKEFLCAFLPWATREHWGEDDMVPGIEDILAKLRGSGESDGVAP